VLANALVGARAGTLSQSFLGGASVATFSIVFLAIAATLAASFLALFLLEEKPLADAPAPITSLRGVEPRPRQNTPENA
jgi:hypothetical protein